MAEGELRLLADFPPVSTEEWEAAIAADLRGADYVKTLVWQSDEGIAVRPYYRQEHVSEDLARPVMAGGWEMLEELPHEGIVDATRWHEQGGTAVEELAFAISAGSDELAAKRTVTGLAFAVGSNYFFEISKLRAARLLWARVAEAYGAGGELKLYAVTALANKSIHDPYTNLLRATTEALSAVIGGCDGLVVQAAGFASRLGQNVQLLLMEESHLNRVADPAGGSYYVEALTGALAREAWAMFQRVETKGGYARATEFIEERLTASRLAKEQAVASRRRTLVGVNGYPDTNERGLGEVDSLGSAGWRLARPMEEIRLRTDRHARMTGKRPKVLLLRRGEQKAQMAQVRFCLNFYGCAGFQVEESDSFEACDADLVVLCASDAHIAGLERSVRSQAQTQVVRGFTDAGPDMVKALSDWQDRLGVGEKGGK
ncbi:MAG: hypothetical protein HZB13_08235 [Acidobacteria bacterium]|nr:hypothetical protein [Acidobacteriota bacterium]